MFNPTPDDLDQPAADGHTPTAVDGWLHRDDGRRGFWREDYIRTSDRGSEDLKGEGR